MVENLETLNYTVETQNFVSLRFYNNMPEPIGFKPLTPAERAEQVQYKKTLTDKSRSTTDSSANSHYDSPAYDPMFKEKLREKPAEKPVDEADEKDDSLPEKPTPEAIRAQIESMAQKSKIAKMSINEKPQKIPNTEVLTKPEPKKIDEKI